MSALFIARGENVNVKAQSPIWLQEKLRRCGIRTIDQL